MGEPVNFKGMVYPQFNREKQVIDVYRFFAERDIITELVIGVDEGTAFDSTCATALAIFRSGRAVVLDCFELDPVESGQKAPTEASRALYQWLCRFLNTFDFVRNVARRWIFECAEGGQTAILSTHLIQEAASLISHAVIIKKGRIIRDAPVEELNGAAYTVSGPAALVDAYISGKKLLSVNAIGGLKSASVEGAPDGDAPAGLEISSIGLQDYFIGLMNEEEGK